MPLGEDHRVVAEDTPRALLTRRDLLLEVNLIHAHTRLPLAAPPGG